MPPTGKAVGLSNMIRAAGCPDNTGLDLIKILVWVTWGCTKIYMAKRKCVNHTLY